MKLRPLPPGIQSLLLPKLIAEAAGSKELSAYEDQRTRAAEAFGDWAKRLRAGVIQGQNETQVEADFTSKLLHALGYRTSGDVAAGEPWSMTPKWAVPGNGICDVALGTFRPDGGGDEVRVVVELKGSGTDLDRAGSRTLSAVQQAWLYLSHVEAAELGDRLELRRNPALCPGQDPAPRPPGRAR